MFTKRRCKRCVWVGGAYSPLTPASERRRGVSLLILLWLITLSSMYTDFANELITHSQREAYMDLVENGGGGGGAGRQQVQEPQGM